MRVILRNNIAAITPFPSQSSEGGNFARFLHDEGEGECIFAPLVCWLPGGNFASLRAHVLNRKSDYSVYNEMRLFRPSRNIGIAQYESAERQIR